MTSDLKWDLPHDGTLWVEHYGKNGTGFFGLNFQRGDGGAQFGPFTSRREVRAAALQLIERIRRGQL